MLLDFLYSQDTEPDFELRAGSLSVAGKSTVDRSAMGSMSGHCSSEAGSAAQSASIVSSCSR